MKMLAKHIMRDRISVGSDTAVKDIAHRLISTNLPGIAVINDKMEVIGVVTEFNVLGAMREGMDLEKITAQRIMSTSPVTADINTSSDDLIQMMLLENYTIIPIVHNNRYVGVVSRHTIMDTYLSPFYEKFTSRDRKGPFVCK
jgi:CBS domain-containing protein